MDEELKKKVNEAPRGTGVYLMRDAADKVIYVGKAKDLRNRVRSYFGNQDTRPMIPFLVPKINNIEFILTDTEKEALILENSLIKEYRPRYNVFFRDDKDYYHLRMDTQSAFPRFELVRRPKKDRATYFGPYSSSLAVKETLHFLQQVFPLRTCKDSVFRTRKRPCIEYEIKRCLGPCSGNVDPGFYGRLVDDSLAFMSGREKSLVQDLYDRMEKASEGLHFEEAARLRDMVRSIESTIEKQKAMSMSFKDQDVFGLYREGDLTQIAALYVRGGRVMGTKKFALVKLNTSSPEIISSLLKQFYSGDISIPREILLPQEIEDRELIEEWLTEKREGKVKVLVPKIGIRKHLLQLANRNAEHLFHADRETKEDMRKTLENLRQVLHLAKTPDRIECIDISNIGGQYAVGSLVSFVEGVPDKAHYRRFKIRTVRETDDYAMIYEIMKRRLSGKGDLPELLVVDGGKGQLNVALAAKRELGVEGLDVIALAKEKNIDARGRREKASRQKIEDRVFLPGKKDPLYLTRFPRELKLLQRVRDEAHRFAIRYHRKLLEKSNFKSVLDEIPGIGPEKKRALLEHFLDLGRIREASIDELKEAPGIGDSQASLIRDFFEKSF